MKSLEDVWQRPEVDRRGGTGRVMRRLLALLVGSLIVLLLLVAAGLVYESVSSARAWRAHPPPGELIDVGDYRLHVHVMGENRGRPAVILDHGGTSMSLQWGWVQPELAQHTQVVAYDRPGMGWSDPAPRQLEAQEAVGHLHSALQQAGITGPYVLVGHSMGALMARTFALRYPDEVAGLVLVDPRTVEQDDSVAGDGAGAQTYARVLSVVARLGIVRITGLADQGAEGLPAEQFEQGVALFPSHRFLKNVGADAYLGGSAEKLLRANPDVEQLPVIVLGASAPDGVFDPEQRAAMNALYSSLAERSPSWSYQEVPGAGHTSIVTHQAPARVVSEAVLTLVNGAAAAR
jgi:pimeloyl-ACP methyl ester carboxylesterase